MSKKRSPIWQYFLCTTEDSRVVNCKVCGDQVSRGGSSTKTFNTTNMVYHLKKHKEEFAAYSASASKGKNPAAATPSNSQPTLLQLAERSKGLDINSSKAQAIYAIIGEMIAIGVLVMTYDWTDFYSTKLRKNHWH